MWQTITKKQKNSKQAYLRHVFVLRTNKSKNFESRMYQNDAFDPILELEFD